MNAAELCILDGSWSDPRAGKIQLLPNQNVTAWEGVGAFTGPFIGPDGVATDAYRWSCSGGGWNTIYVPSPYGNGITLVDGQKYTCGFYVKTSNAGHAFGLCNGNGIGVTPARAAYPIPYLPIWTLVEREQTVTGGSSSMYIFILGLTGPGYVEFSRPKVYLGSKVS